MERCRCPLLRRVARDMAGEPVVAAPSVPHRSHPDGTRHLGPHQPRRPGPWQRSSARLRRVDTAGSGTRLVRQVGHEALRLGAMVKASTSEDYFTTIDSKTYPGKWRVVFFWPKDFTFVCPTGVVDSGRLNSEFADRDARALGVFVDNEFVHYAWRIQHPTCLTSRPDALRPEARTG